MTSADPMSLYDRLMAVKPPSLSRNAWAMRAELSRVVFNDIRKRGGAKLETVEKLLEAIGVTLAEFEAGMRQPEKEPSSRQVRAPYLAFRGQDRPRDVPIVGTAECADIEFPDNGSAIDVEAMSLDFDEIVDYARRPASLDNRRDVYAIYFRGTSLSPRFEPGELGYVDPRQPPKLRDYVVVQLCGADNDEERVVKVIAKRLVRQSASYIELEQFSPAAVFRVARKDIKHVHRIIPFDELVTF